MDIVQAYEQVGKSRNKKYILYSLSYSPKERDIQLQNLIRSKNFNQFPN